MNERGRDKPSLDDILDHFGRNLFRVLDNLDHSDKTGKLGNDLLLSVDSEKNDDQTNEKDFDDHHVVIEHVEHVSE